MRGLRLGVSYLVQNRFKVVEQDIEIEDDGEIEIETETEIFDNKRLIGSLEYVVGQWTFAAEYEHLMTKPRYDDEDGDSEDGSGRLFYVSASRRINDRWEVGAYYSGTRKSRGVSYTDLSSARRLDEIALCVRHDFNPHVTAKLEGHWIDGTASVFDVPGSRNPVESRSDRWFLFAAKVAVNF